jgi:hypothetical protein
VANLTRLTHKLAIQLHPVAESCIICSSCSRRPVLKLLDTPSYVLDPPNTGIVDSNPTRGMFFSVVLSSAGRQALRWANPLPVQGIQPKFLNIFTVSGDNFEP